MLGLRAYVKAEQEKAPEAAALRRMFVLLVALTGVGMVVGTLPLLLVTAYGCYCCLLSGEHLHT